MKWLLVRMVPNHGNCRKVIYYWHFEGKLREINATHPLRWFHVIFLQNTNSKLLFYNVSCFHELFLSKLGVFFSKTYHQSLYFISSVYLYTCCPISRNGYFSFEKYLECHEYFSRKLMKNEWYICVIFRNNVKEPLNKYLHTA